MIIDTCSRVGWSLHRQGVTSPETVGFCCLLESKAGDDGTVFSQVNHCRIVQTEIAMEKLISSITNGQKGFPKHPTRTLVQGFWEDHNTL